MSLSFPDRFPDRQRDRQTHTHTHTHTQTDRELFYRLFLLVGVDLSLKTYIHPECRSSLDSVIVDLPKEMHTLVHWIYPMHEN